MEGGRHIFWQSSEYSLNFNANDDNANFDNRTNLSNANDNNSGGLLFVKVVSKKSPDIRDSFATPTVTSSSRRACVQSPAASPGGGRIS